MDASDVQAGLDMSGQAEARARAAPTKITRGGLGLEGSRSTHRLVGHRGGGGGQRDVGGFIFDESDNPRLHAAKAELRKLDTHPEHASRLVWLEHILDEYAIANAKMDNLDEELGQTESDVQDLASERGVTLRRTAPGGYGGGASARRLLSSE